MQLHQVSAAWLRVLFAVLIAHASLRAEDTLPGPAVAWSGTVLQVSWAPVAGAQRYQVWTVDGAGTRALGDPVLATTAAIEWPSSDILSVRFTAHAADGTVLATSGWTDAIPPALIRERDGVRTICPCAEGVSHLPPEAVPTGKSLQGVSDKTLFAPLAATSDVRINGILTGYRWTGPVVTYSFYDPGVWGMIPSGAFSDRTGISEAGKANVRRIMAEYALITGLQLVEVVETPDTVGHIRVSASSGLGGGFAYYPWSQSVWSDSGDVYVGRNLNIGGAPGSQGYEILIHEIGHAMGLKHPHEDGVTYPAADDHNGNSVMSYDEVGAMCAVPARWDQLALRHLYGNAPARTGDDLWTLVGRLNGTAWHTQLANGTEHLYPDSSSAKYTLLDTGGSNILDLGQLPVIAAGYRVDLREMSIICPADQYDANPSYAEDFNNGVSLAPGTVLGRILTSPAADEIWLGPGAETIAGYQTGRANGDDVLRGAGTGDVLDLRSFPLDRLAQSRVGDDLVVALSDGAGGSRGTIRVVGHYAGSPITLQTASSATFLQFAQSALTQSEGSIDSTVTVTVRRSGSASAAVGCTWSVAGGTATVGTDVIATGGTLAWGAGDDADKTFTVTVRGDTSVEPNETVRLVLGAPSGGAQLGTPAQTLLTIVNDDQAPNAVIRFAGTAPTVGEPAAGTIRATATVQRVGGSGRVSAEWKTTAGTATAGSDFTAASGILVWADGDWSSRTVSVDILADDLAEADETLRFDLSTPLGRAVLAAPTQMTVTIRDGDVATEASQRLVVTPTTLAVPEGTTATGTVRLAQAPAGTVSVALARSAGDTDVTVAPATLSFTAADWSTAKAFTVGAAQDADALNGTATITASSAGLASVDCAITEVDDERQALVVSSTARTVPEGGTSSFTVRLGVAPTANVTVAIANAGGDGDLVASPTSLTFTTANWSTAQTVTVGAAQDADAVAGSAQIAVSTATAATVTITATEQDDDTQGIVYEPDPITAMEAGSLGVRVRLAAQPTQDVVVAYTASGAVSTTVNSTPLTFTPNDWDQARYTSLNVPWDQNTTDDSATITFTAPSIPTRTATFTVIDQNSAPRFFLSTTRLQVAEGGEAYVTVRLTSAPSATTTVTVTRTSGDADLAAVIGSLTFTAQNYYQVQKLAIGAAQDADAADGTAQFTLAGGGIPAATLTATELDDDDMPGFVLSTPTLTVPEGGSATFTVRLDRAPAGEVVATVARLTGGDTSLTAAPTSLTFGAATWNTPQTVTVTAAQDADAIPGSAAIRVSATGWAPAECVATEQDDDQPALTVTPASLAVREGSSGTFAVTLSGVPAADVTVTATRTAGDTDVTVTGSPVVITPATWDVARTITVAAAQDGDTTDGTATITFAATGLASVARTVTEQDDDAVPTMPGALTATVVTNQRIDLAWTASTDNVGVTGYEVKRNGAVITTVTAIAYSDTGVAEGGTYAYTVTALDRDGNRSAGATASATIATDAVRPTLVSAVASSATTVLVTFSEPVETASAQTAANYALSGGIAVTGAALQADTRQVLLTTGSLAAGISYTLTVSNVRDRAIAPNSILAGSTIAFTRPYPNLALTATATATASFSGNVAARVNDGDPATYWRGGTTWPQEVVLTWATAQTFNRVVVTAPNTNVGSWRIDTWDGSAWVNLVSSRTTDPTGTWNVATVTTTRIRWVAETSENDRPQLKEFEVYFIDGGANAAPVITQGATTALTVLEDGTGSLTLNATDADGDTLTWSIASQGTKGTATASGTGASRSVGYVPAANQVGTDSFVVQVADGRGGLATITVDVTITAVNDAPSFTKGGDQTVLEDSGARSVSGWATSISRGPADEGGQTLTFGVTTSNAALFSSAPAIAANGTLTFTPAANANGSATVTVTLSDNGGTANGGVATSAAQTFTITVAPVNDAPSFTKGANQTVAEDSAARTVTGWATAISRGPADEAAQTVSFTAVAAPATLFSVQPAIAANGTLTFTPAPNANGTATVTVTLTDNGGTATGGSDTSAAQTFTITLTPVNDPPVVATPIPDQSATVGQAFTWVIPAGTVTDIDSPTLTWSTNEALGWLSFAPATRTFSGTPGAGDVAATTITVTASDGALSVSDAFVLTVTATPNTAPAITTAKPATLTTREDAQASLALAATDAEGDALTWTVTTPPTKGTAAVSGSGASVSVAFTPSANANGSDSFTVRVADGRGGTDTILVNVTITAVNDAPSFTKGANQTVLEDSGARSVSGWATAISAGPADESGQTLTFGVTTTNTALFSVQPAVAANGTLTFTTAANANGSATVTVTLADDGGTANGGVATSAAQTFTIAVTAVNDAPSFATGADVTVNAGAGAQTVTGWATAISAGPGDESAQTLTFTTSASAPALFSVQPAVAANGTLTFTPAPTASGSATVTVTLTDSGGTANGGVNATSRTFTIAIVGAGPPTVASAAAATPNPVTGTSTTLSVLGADDGGEAALTYTWSVVSKPTGAADPVFSANAANAARNVTATFARAGSYGLRATIRDAAGGTATSQVTVTVIQTATAMTVSPGAATVLLRTSQALTASVRDQFGNAFATQPALTWSVQSGAGSVSTGGVYTAPGAPGVASVRVAGGGVSATATITAVASTVPAPWTGEDVGAPAPAGVSSTAGGLFTLTAAGVDIWRSSDQFHFVHRGITGDGVIVARVDSLINTHSWAKAGIMIRETTAAGARHAFLAVTPGNGVAFQRRTASGAASASTSGGSGTAPVWLKLERVGNVITAWRSGDGQAWKFLAQATVTMGADVRIGLALTSHAPGTLTTATFTNVTVTGVAAAGG